MTSLLSRASPLCLLLFALLGGCGGPKVEPPGLDGGESADAGELADGGETPWPDGGTFPYDVVVVGAGTGGWAAAVQAARMGARVALLEETDWIGGQAAASGVPNMDEGSHLERDYGLYRELVVGLRARYAAAGKSLGTCYWSSGTICPEPSMVQRVMEELIEGARQGGAVLEVRRGVTVVEVPRSGATVVGARVDNGDLYAAPVVIDATEYGDLLPLAGARYRVGNSLSDRVDPSACIQDITYTAIVRKHTVGVPPGLSVAQPPPGYDEERPYFARIVAPGGATWFDGTYPVDFVTHNAYRGLPDSTQPGDYTAGGPAAAAAITKTSLNYANDYPAHAPYVAPDGWVNPVLAVAYLEDRAFRRAVDCEAKLRTLQFIHYVQTAMGEPLWSVADDEGYDTPRNRAARCPNLPAQFDSVERHFPPRPYVRESRRVVGLFTLRALDIQRVPERQWARTSFPSAMAVGWYGNDLHNCNQDAQLESGLEGRADISSAGGPFQLPFAAFIPETVDGLVPAEKNLSMTRLVSGAARLQPVTIASGQAAGALAALAATSGLPPRKVRAVEVQEALVKAGARLSLFHYDDVPTTDPRWADVELASTHEVMGGPTGNTSASHFGRDEVLTRSEAAAVLGKLLQLRPVWATMSFDDVPWDHPQRAWIEALKKAGLTAGCSASPPLYCPASPLTRASLAAFLVRGMKLELVSPATPTFTDVPTSDPRFATIETAAREGLMGGCDATKFCPDGSLTRVEVAGVVRRALLRLR